MYKIIVFLIGMFSGLHSQAQVLGPSCMIGANVNAVYHSDWVLVPVVDRPAALGLTCDETKNLFKAAEAINMTILPATIVLRTPGVRESIMAEMAAMGLTFANPAVLGVTVLGSVGYVTIYFVLKASLEECENLRFQEQLKREVDDRIAVKYRKPIEVRR